MAAHGATYGVHGLLRYSLECFAKVCLDYLLSLDLGLLQTMA